LKLVGLEVLFSVGRTMISFEEAAFPPNRDHGPLTAVRDLLKTVTSSTGEGRVSDYTIKLYVTGKTPRSEQAIMNLRRICDEELSGRYELMVIDVLERPQLAEDEKILATPTVVKELPVPIRRIIGDLSDRERVLLGLDLRPARGVEGRAREGS
jgi:circadian clock protein KaiB